MDIDGILLREGSEDDALSPVICRQLGQLAKHYDLAWATSWEDTANTLLRKAGCSSWPVVPVDSRAGRSPDGYASSRVAPMLDFVGRRSFAWVDDQLDRGDATTLVAEHDCLLLRPNPQNGLTGDDIRRLHDWA